MASKKDRVSKEEALNFLLTHLVIERGLTLELDQKALFSLINLAQQASVEIASTEGVIPHEVIEQFAGQFLEGSG